jgi:hypothetical protein
VAGVLSTLEAQRSDADYDVAVVFTDDMASEALAQAREFAAAVRHILTADGYL